MRSRSNARARDPGAGPRDLRAVAQRDFARRFLRRDAEQGGGRTGGARRRGVDRQPTAAACSWPTRSICDRPGLIENQVGQQQHGRLLHQVMSGTEGALVAPHSGTGDATDNDENAAANPTDFLLVLAPVHNDQGPQGVVEIFQRSGARSPRSAATCGSCCRCASSPATS